MKLNDILIEKLITEGVYDPSIFKVIFMAGGPGSGKSFIAGKSTGGLGFKFVNSDTMFELLMRRAKLSLKMPDSEEKERNAVRSTAKAKTGKLKANYLEGRLGMIIDGTGRNYSKIAKQKAELEALGYDTYMVFVNTSKEVALERNRLRARSVPEDIVVKAWNDVQNNIGKFQSLFGRNNMSIVDNNNAGENVFNKLWKEVMKFSKQKIRNGVARDWIKKQLAQKKR